MVRMDKLLDAWRADPRVDATIELSAMLIRATIKAAPQKILPTAFVAKFGREALDEHPQHLEVALSVADLYLATGLEKLASDVVERASTLEGGPGSPRLRELRERLGKHRRTQELASRTADLDTLDAPTSPLDPPTEPVTTTTARRHPTAGEMPIPMPPPGVGTKGIGQHPRRSRTLLAGFGAAPPPPPPAEAARVPITVPQPSQPPGAPSRPPPQPPLGLPPPPPLPFSPSPSLAPPGASPLVPMPTSLGLAPAPPLPFATRPPPEGIAPARAIPPPAPSSDPGERTSGPRPAARKPGIRRPPGPRPPPMMAEPLEDTASEVDDPTKVTALPPLGPRGLAVEAAPAAPPPPPPRAAMASMVDDVPTRSASVREAMPSLLDDGPATRAIEPGDDGPRTQVEPASGDRDDPPTRTQVAPPPKMSMSGPEPQPLAPAPARPPPRAAMLSRGDDMPTRARAPEDDAPPTRTAVAPAPGAGTPPRAPPPRPPGQRSTGGLRQPGASVAPPPMPSTPPPPMAAPLGPPPPPPARFAPAPQPPAPFAPPPRFSPAPVEAGDDDGDVPTRMREVGGPRGPYGSSPEDPSSMTDVEGLPPDHVRAAAVAQIAVPGVAPADPETDSTTAVRDLAPMSRFPPQREAALPSRPPPAGRAPSVAPVAASVVRGGTLAMKHGTPPPMGMPGAPPPADDDEVPRTYILSPAEAHAAAQVDPRRPEASRPAPATLASEVWPAPSARLPAGGAVPLVAAPAAPMFGPPPSSGFGASPVGISVVPGMAPPASAPPDSLGQMSLGGLPATELGSLPRAGGGYGVIDPNSYTDPSYSDGGYGHPLPVSGAYPMPAHMPAPMGHPMAVPPHGGMPGAPFGPGPQHAWGAQPVGPASPSGFPAAGAFGDAPVPVARRPLRLYAALGAAALAVASLVAYATYLLVIAPPGQSELPVGERTIPPELSRSLLAGTPAELARAQSTLRGLEGEGDKPELALARLRLAVISAFEVTGEAGPVQEAITKGRAATLPEEELVLGELALALLGKDAAATAQLVTAWDAKRGRDPFWQLLRGIELERRGDPTARERLAAALAIEPTMHAAEVRLVRNLLLTGAIEDARRRLDALPADQPSRRGLEALAWVVQRLGSDQAGPTPQDLPVSAEVSRALHPTFAAVSVLGARTADIDGATRTAITEAEAPAVALLFGEIALFTEQGDNAILASRRALELQPGNAPAVALLGRAALVAGRFEQLEAQIAPLPPELTRGLRATLAYERGDVATLRDIASKVGDAEDPTTGIRTRLARLEGKKALAPEAIANVVAKDRVGGELVAVDAWLDAGELVRAREIVARWQRPGAHPLRAPRLSRLLRYEGKTREASGALANAPSTSAVLVERVLIEAEAKGGLDHVLSTIDERVGPSRPFLEAYVLARGGDVDDAKRRLEPLTPPSFDALLSLRITAALAYAEVEDEEHGPPLVGVLLEAFPKNPDVRRAARRLGVKP